MKKTPFVRAAANPLIVPEQIRPWLPGFKVTCAFNAGVARYGDETLLLLRVAEKPPEAEAGHMHVPVLEGTGSQTRVTVQSLRLDDPRYDFSDPRKVLDRTLGSYVFLTSLSHLRLARSRDGIHFTVEEQPFLAPDQTLEAFGTEDARITQLEGRFLINYTAVSPYGITTALAETGDFRTVRKRGVIFVTENRDVCLFPEKIHGKYYALIRPVPRQIGRARIWLAASEDLMHWGEFVPLALPDFPWGMARSGGGAPPLKTDRGWLILYHGASPEDNRYSMGAALLDADNPSRVLAVSRNPVLAPEAPYETEGFYPNVVFSCGALLDAGTVRMYYGAADRVMALATADLADLWRVMEPPVNA